MKCSELFRLIKAVGWKVVSQEGSHVKLKHADKPGTIIFPMHGNHEMGKGLERRIKKVAGIK